MPQNTSVSGRVTHTVADLTGRTDDGDQAARRR